MRRGVGGIALAAIVIPGRGQPADPFFELGPGGGREAQPQHEGMRRAVRRMSAVVEAVLTVRPSATVRADRELLSRAATRYGVPGEVAFQPVDRGLDAWPSPATGRGPIGAPRPSLQVARRAGTGPLRAGAA